MTQAATPAFALGDFLASRPRTISRGPIAMILCEDTTEIEASLRFHLLRGFRHILALSPEPLVLPAALIADGRVTNLIHDTRRPDAHVAAVNALIDAVPAGTWLYYGYNAEFLFYPFCETRSIGELLAFHTEERRDAMLAYVIDLYAPDLQTNPDAVSLEHAMFDRTGYYALGRKHPGAETEQYEDRQLDFHGGLRWRFEEHIPANRRNIDRIALFRAEPGLRVTPEHRFNQPEYNTYACPWHHSLTCAIGSFRVAKALARNPDSRDRIGGFIWRNSAAFEWRGQQLMDLGLMEPGQWF
ncbi:hypothetical protein FNJ84_06570 [Paracoccus sp. M683]|uniref:glycosyltransferase family 2 protein n=1 Tax=Paracoccus sp. M683 TaxID=2594268 RepID=UPI00117FE078|nr:glycosyltransferase family 2 protein [Paracoccus sp. M683]TRW98430.1 hypothetical protein FNJ84_06570 [Paracoccus sp. M683]